MNRIKYFVFVLALLAIETSAMAQLQQQQVKEGLLHLQQSIQTYNPALHQYNAHFDSLSTQIITSVQQDQVSHLEYFALASKICALSNEGHFGLGNWKDTVHQGFLNNHYKYLPVSVTLLKGKLYVWKDYSNEHELTRGSEIVAINGKSTTSILQQLQQTTPSDGTILTYTHRAIELGFSWRYYLYIEQPEAFRMTIKNTDGTTTDHPIEALTRNQAIENANKYNTANAGKKAAPEPEQFYTLEHKEGYSMLRLSSFDRGFIEKHKVKSKSLYKTIFKALAELEVKHLVVDLRDNTGGKNEFADDIVPYIMKAPSSDPFLKKTISWEGKKKTYPLPKPSKEAFQGTIYVLVNGRTYSAGNTMARYLKEYGNAVVIGEETGTRYEGFAAGSKQYITLPHTNIKIGIPRYHITFPKSQKQTTANKGLLPLYEVQYTFEDLLQENDLHMKEVTSLLNGNVGK